MATATKKSKHLEPVQPSEITKVKIDDFLNKDVKDFARYVVETRACPKLSDGLRTGARKVIYAAMTGDLKRKSKIKMNALVGDTFKLEYHHGDMSLYNTIIQLASDYLNKYKPLQVQGQIGYIRQTKIDVAPRYLSVGQHQNLDIYRVDSELWDILVDEGQKIEPVTFYPIVPTTLLYRTNSPGMGFSFNVFSYTLDSIIMNCLESIFTGTCTNKTFPLVPEVVGYDNNNFIYNYNKDQWFSIGDFECDFENDILTITNLPYSVQYEQYEEILLNLRERLIIRDFSNLSKRGEVKYVIRFRNKDLTMLWRDKWKFFQMFHLFKKVRKDILNVINEYSNIVHYEDAYHLIDAFVKYRLKIYDRRKKNTIEILSQKIDEMEIKIKFIRLVIEKKLIVENRKLKDIKPEMDNYGLPYELLRISISHLTQDEIEKLEREIRETKEYLEYIKRTTIEDMYVSELIEMKENFTNNVTDFVKRPKKQTEPDIEDVDKW